MSRIVTQPKLAGETQTFSFDFISRLAVGETISTQVVAATVWSGTDSNPSAVISGSATASGTIVNQAITGGVVGVIYSLVCTITTSFSQTLKLATYMAVTTDLP